MPFTVYQSTFVHVHVAVCICLVELIITCCKLLPLISRPTQPVSIYVDAWYGAVGGTMGMAYACYTLCSVTFDPPDIVLESSPLYVRIALLRTPVQLIVLESIGLHGIVGVVGEVFITLGYHRPTV